ncbi:hypothetical protein F5X97DRAFT_328493 [Nemania serpens]|nr:hypothetical protein F5X97DRAFT_328493 [Nemania serpens]
MSLKLVFWIMVVDVMLSQGHSGILREGVDKEEIDFAAVWPEDEVKMNDRIVATLPLADSQHACNGSLETRSAHSPYNCVAASNYKFVDRNYNSNTETLAQDVYENFE